MRKLASIQKVLSIAPIEGADNIEVARVLGWYLVVKKGDFQVGDIAVYIEIDSILSDRPEFEFMKPRGMRVKTIKLRGQVSQGLLFPISILPEKDSAVNFIEDQDVTEALGIIQFEAPVPAELAGKMKGSFPSFIPKTDETRVQILHRVVEKYAGEEFYATEKIDGSSATFYLNDGVFGVCSRNIDLLEDSINSFWRYAREYNIEERMRSVSNFNNWALQGELFGEGIQGNKLQIKGQHVRFFNVFNIDDFEYLDFEDFEELISGMKLPTVPILMNFSLPTDIDTIVELSKIKSQINTEVWAEGIVLRPVKETLDLAISNGRFTNARVSFKAINPNWLLKYGE